MKLLSIEELKALAQLSEESCISLFMPTHRMEPGTLQDPIRFRNLLREAEERLIEHGIREEVVREWLEPVEKLDQLEFWQHQSDGLSLLLSQTGFQYYCLPLSFEKQVVVGDRFYLKPVLPLFNGDGCFYVLALSQQQIRLFQGTRHHIDEMVYAVETEEMSDHIPLPATFRY